MRLERESSRTPDPRPRILQFVNNFHFGGTEGQTVELIRGLSGRYQTFAAAIHCVGVHLSAIRGMGLEPLEVRLTGSFARPNTIGQIVRLGRFLRRERIDLVHAQDFYTALLGVPAAKLAGTKVVVGRLDLGHWHNPAQKMLLAAATRAADHVIANAEAIKRQVVASERLPAQRVSVIHNGIDLNRFDARSQAALTAPLPALNGRVAIVHLANMIHPVKAQEDLFEAMNSLRRTHPSALLLLVGDGPRRSLLENMARQMGMARDVHFLGHRPDVPAILVRCQLAVLCSHAEGLSNAIIESMAASLPMVVTDAGGNKELVSHEERGFVVPIKSPCQLAAKIGELVASESLRLRMGAAGRAYVERELTMDALLERHESLYRSLLKRSGIDGD